MGTLQSSYRLFPVPGRTDLERRAFDTSRLLRRHCCHRDYGQQELCSETHKINRLRAPPPQPRDTTPLTTLDTTAALIAIDPAELPVFASGSSRPTRLLYPPPYSPALNPIEKAW